MKCEGRGEKRAKDLINEVGERKRGKENESPQWKKKRKKKQIISQQRIELKGDRRRESG